MHCLPGSSGSNDWLCLSKMVFILVNTAGFFAGDMSFWFMRGFSYECAGYIGELIKAEGHNAYSDDMPAMKQGGCVDVGEAD